MVGGASTRKPTLAEVIRSAIDYRLLRLRTCIPAKVVRYDASKQLVDCQVLVQQPYLDEEDNRQVESLPVVTNCPVQFPGAKWFRVTFPISDGNLTIDGASVPATTGLLVFAERSLDAWLSGSGQEVDPEIDHDHAIADGVFIPGVNPFGATLASCPTDHATAGADGGVQVHFHGQTICVGDEAGSDFVAMAQKVMANFNALFNLLDGVFGASSTALVTPTPGSPDVVYAAMKAAIAVLSLAGSWPAQAVAASQAKAK